jgi:hypothetical protein
VAVSTGRGASIPRPFRHCAAGCASAKAISTIDRASGGYPLSLMIPNAKQPVLSLGSRLSLPGGLILPIAPILTIGPSLPAIRGKLEPAPPRAVPGHPPLPPVTGAIILAIAGAVSPIISRSDSLSRAPGAIGRLLDGPAKGRAGSNRRWRGARGRMRSGQTSRRPILPPDLKKVVMSLAHVAIRDCSETSRSSGHHSAQEPR